MIISKPCTHCAKLIYGVKTDAPHAQPRYGVYCTHCGKHQAAGKEAIKPVTGEGR